MIKYNCKKCLHNPICSYAADATKEAREFKQASKLAVIECDLCCKHYDPSCGCVREDNNEY